jgi:iron complex transport system permease protein
MPSRRRALVVLLVLALAALASMAVALAVGSLVLPVGDVLAALAGDDNMAHAVIFDLRLPRALAAFGCGGLLALAGALMQVLLRNPLADPRDA